MNSIFGDGLCDRLVCLLIMDLLFKDLFCVVFIEKIFGIVFSSLLCVLMLVDSLLKFEVFISFLGFFAGFGEFGRDGLGDGLRDSLGDELQDDFGVGFGLVFRVVFGEGF